MKGSKAIAQVLAIIALMTGFSAHLHAQLNIPLTNCQNLAGIYTDLGTTGTVITTTGFDDANSAATNIGFTFNFNGTAFTQFVLNTNGFIRLGASPPSVAALFFSSATSTTGGPFNSTSTSDVNILAAFNHDLNGATGAEYRVNTEGTQPNRKCIIQFKNLYDKTTSPAQQFASISFQIILYESTDIIEFVYSTFTASANAEAFKSAAVGIKGSGFAAGQLITVTKGSTTIYSAATFINGNYTGNAFNFRNSVLPDAGRTIRFMPIKPNDRAIMEVYTLGKSPIPFGNPMVITAWVKNGGTNAQTASTCTLNITGANPYNNVQTLPALLSGDSTLVTFASFSPTVTGINNVEVTIPSDDNTLNNVKTKVIETNLNSYSYAQGPTPAGGVGFTGATGDFVAKFTTTSAQSVNQVDVNFSTGGQPFQIGIWAAGGTGTPGTLLHTSSTHTSATGVYTVLIDPPVSIPAGSFFVGVKQTGSTNVSFAYQPEVPIRSGTFYYTSPTGGTTWTDFAPGSPFRFMIEPKFALQTDVGITAVTPATGTTLVAGHAYNLSAMVVNYGLLAQNNIPVYYNVNGGTPVGPVTTTSSIVQNGTATVNFTGAMAFTPATVGNHVLRFFTQLTNDLSTQNDTMTITFPVVPAALSSFPYTENFTTRYNWTISGVGQLWRYGIATGATGINNDTAAFASFYDVLAGNTAMLKSPAFKLSALTNPTLQFDVAYRTSSSENDSLQVLVSTDGGITFLEGTPPLYLKSAFSSPGLPTTLADTTQFFPSGSAQWRQETVSLGQFGSDTTVMLAFKAYSANGNNCWVDNVKIFQGTVPTITTAAATSITTHSAVSGGDVTAAGSTPVTSRGVCWSTTPGPTILDAHTTNGSGTGSFVSNVTGLATATTYHLRAYAINGSGTAYGSEITFNTLAPATVPTVTTDTVTSITHYSAVSGGNVTSDGNATVTARGVCYSILPNPTIADAFTNDGTGAGPFTSNITGLDDNTFYYVRAYATNTIGIAYGAQMTFTTLIDGIEETPEEWLNVYVSQQKLIIVSSRNRVFSSLHLYDMTGKLAACYDEQHCAPMVQLNLPDLPSGSYILNLIENEGSRQVKLVVP